MPTPDARCGKPGERADVDVLVADSMQLKSAQTHEIICTYIYIYICIVIYRLD